MLVLMCGQFSHRLPSKKGDAEGGHFHLSKPFVRDLKANSERVVFSAKAGDVFIFGMTVPVYQKLGRTTQVHVW